MAGTRFQVKTYGANLVARHLYGMARRAEDLRPAWPAVARRAATGYGRSFDRSGPGWPGLKPSTQRQRIREGFPPGPPLRKSGDYYRAATNPAALILIEGRDFLEIAVDDEVARYHQDGTKRMAVRQLKLSFGDRMLIVKEIDKTLIAGYLNG
jgi:hypothetical protein